MKFLVLYLGLGISHPVVLVRVPFFFFTRISFFGRGLYKFGVFLLL